VTSKKSSAAFGAFVETNTEVYNPFKKEENTVTATSTATATPDVSDVPRRPSHTAEENTEDAGEASPRVANPCTSREKKSPQPFSSSSSTATGHAPPPPTAENVILRLNVKHRPANTVQSMDSVSGVPGASSYSADVNDDGGVAASTTASSSSMSSTKRRPFAYNEFESPLAQGGGVGSSGNINRYAHYGSDRQQHTFEGGFDVVDGWELGGGGGCRHAARTSCSSSSLAPQQHGGGTHHPPPLRKMRLLMELEEKSKSGEWPASSSVHCYWCCHRFPGMPYGLPHRYDNNGRFIVTGCFCSLECAAAYNFHGDTSCSAEEMWTRYSLINMLAARMRDVEEEEEDEAEHEKTRKPSSNYIVKQAPHRLSLSIFGGGLSIEEFRSSFQRGRRTLLHAPPMVSACQQVEEITDGDVYSVNHFIPVDTERIDRYQEQMRLKRNKPLAGSKKNIIKMMNIQFTNR